MQILSSLSSSQSDPISPWPLSPNLINHSDPISTYQILTPNSSSRVSHSTASKFPTPKRRRLPLPSRTSFRQQSTPANSSGNSNAPTPNLAACHVCHRRPSSHAQLPAYSSCELCEQRICYICIRVCEADGCRSCASSGEIRNDSDRETRNVSSNASGLRGKVVCRKCCNEVLTEGNVWCLVGFEEDDEEDQRGRGSGDEADEERNCDETGRVEEWLDSFR